LVSSTTQRASSSSGVSGGINSARWARQKSWNLRNVSAAVTNAICRPYFFGYRYAELSVNHDPIWGHVQPAAVLSDPLLVLEMIETAEHV